MSGYALLKNDKRVVVVCAVMALVALVIVWQVRFSWSGQFAGLYLLKGSNGHLLEVADDLFLGDEEVLLAGIDFDRATHLFAKSVAAPAARLEFAWNEADGNGYVRNHLGDGKVLVTNFSRYRDSQRQHTHGLFIGGASPSALHKDSPWHQNDSGMTYFDGQGWNHIWCNTNEGIGSTVTPQRYAPSSWKFLGSKVVQPVADQVILSSLHEIDVNGVPLRMERSVRFAAGEPYLDLTIRIVNVGNQDGKYFYYYGDEPWLGDFGSAAGDIGWVGEQLVQHEDVIDSKRYSYAGMVDYGNDQIGEGHNFRHVANFIEWLGPDRPDVVFFANQYDGFSHDPKVRVPLQGDGRSIGMYWGPRLLQPGQEQVINLSIGMAGVDRISGKPIMPVRKMHAQVQDAAPRQPLG